MEHFIILTVVTSRFLCLSAHSTYRGGLQSHLLPFVCPVQISHLCPLMLREGLLANTATEPQVVARAPSFHSSAKSSVMRGKKSFPRQREQRPTFWRRRKLKREEEAASASEARRPAELRRVSSINQEAGGREREIDERCERASERASLEEREEATGNAPPNAYELH